jgi:hypothetical protein
MGQSQNRGRGAVPGRRYGLPGVPKPITVPGRGPQGPALTNRAREDARLFASSTAPRPASRRTRLVLREPTAARRRETRAPRLSGPTGRLVLAVATLDSGVALRAIKWAAHEAMWPWPDQGRRSTDWGGWGGGAEFARFARSARTWAAASSPRRWQITPSVPSVGTSSGCCSTSPVRRVSRGSGARLA